MNFNKLLDKIDDAIGYYNAIPIDGGNYDKTFYKLILIIDPTSELSNIENAEVRRVVLEARAIAERGDIKLAKRAFSLLQRAKSLL